MFWPPNSYYFITCKTFLGEKLFDCYNKKKIILEQIRKAAEELKIPIYAYSIARNHYHILVFLNDYNKLARLKQIINGGSSFLFGQKFEKKTGSIWVDTKTLIVENEASISNVMGYIAGNLLKHGEVKDFGELKCCTFSSYRQLAERYGNETAEDLVKRVILVEEDDYCLPDLKCF